MPLTDERLRRLRERATDELTTPPLSHSLWYVQDIVDLVAEVAVLRAALRDCVGAMERDDPTEGWQEILDAARALVPAEPSRSRSGHDVGK